MTILSILRYKISLPHFSAMKFFRIFPPIASKLMKINIKLIKIIQIEIPVQLNNIW